MKLHLYRYECKNCGCVYKSPELLEDTYGDFLLRSQSGKIAYLDAINNFYFNEFNKIVKINNELKYFSDLDKADLLHKIYGIACDLASDGTQYNIGQKAYCPKCRLLNLSSWGPTSPPEIIDQDVEFVTHDKWSKLSTEERESVIDKTISDYLSQFDK